eukprot:COSAG05_NODE_3327_length_2148_cov_1.820888_2_plen_108_part_00
MTEIYLHILRAVSSTEEYGLLHACVVPRGAPDPAQGVEGGGEGSAAAAAVVIKVARDPPELHRSMKELQRQQQVWPCAQQYVGKSQSCMAIACRSCSACTAVYVARD